MAFEMMSSVLGHKENLLNYWVFTVLVDVEGNIGTFRLGTFAKFHIYCPNLMKFSFFCFLDFTLFIQINLNLVPLVL